MALTETDLVHLRRCVELAREAFDAGDEPFGSLIIEGGGSVRFEDRNRVSGGDATRHPEIEIARWSATGMTGTERAQATVYTSGEHCPMCSAAHAWMGLGRIVYAASSAQLTGWLSSWGAEPGRVLPLAIRQVAPTVAVDGPAPTLQDEMQALHLQQFEREQFEREQFERERFERERSEHQREQSR